MSSLTSWRSNPHAPDLRKIDGGAADPAVSKEEESNWYDDVSLGLFADAYAGVNFNVPRPAAAPNTFRAFDPTNGFALHWAGLNLNYEGEAFGATVALRFGPGAVIYNGGDVQQGLAFAKQAFATWKPQAAKGRLRFDMGKFDTLYGAEVAESQSNFNYTRGVLNWLGQPFFHTGLRAGFDVTDAWSLTLIAVNGWNNSVDNNFGKSGGAQIGWSPSDKVGVYLGYLTGPENDRRVAVDCDLDTALDGASGRCVDAPGAEASSTELTQRGSERRFRQFGDVIIAINPTNRLSFVLNADLGYDEVISNPVTGEFDRVVWYGGALGARYQFTPRFASALRGEGYQDLQGFTIPTPAMIGTGTLTLEFAPVEQVLLRLDSRYDGSNEPLFAAGLDDARNQQVTLTLGAVVMTR